MAGTLRPTWCPFHSTGRGRPRRHGRPLRPTNPVPPAQGPVPRGSGGWLSFGFLSDPRLTLPDMASPRLCPVPDCGQASYNTSGPAGKCLACIETEFSSAGLTLLGRYERTTMPVLVRCNTDPRHLFKVKLSLIRSGHRACSKCPRTVSCSTETCQGVVEKDTKGLGGRCLSCIDQVLLASRVKRLGSYLGTKMPLSVLCLTCNETRITTFGQVVRRGFGCTRCGKRSAAAKRLKPKDEVERHFMNAGLTLLDNYDDYYRSMRARCGVCDEVVGISLQVVVRREREGTSGIGCTECVVGAQHEAARLTLDEARLIFKLADAEIVGTYISVMKPVEVRCQTCGGLSRVRLNSIQNGQSPCWPCGRARAKDVAQVVGSPRVLPGVIRIGRREIPKIGVGLAGGRASAPIANAGPW